MDAFTIWEFIKKNGGAAVAIVLLYMNTGKLESRLDKVEGMLFDCYQSKVQNASNPRFKRDELLAILPEQIKIKKNGKNEID